MKQIKIIVCLAASVMAVSCVCTQTETSFPSSATDTSRPAIKTSGRIPYWKGKAPNGTNTFRFVVMSDRTGGYKPGEWEQAVAEINLIKPDFVICVGDLIEGYTSNRTEHVHMQNEIEAMIRKLKAPFYMCPGNHDMSNPIMYKGYVARYGVDGKPYYSFNYRNSHFVVLDAASIAYNTNMLNEEIDWLAADLKQASGMDHVFLFYHIPQWGNAAVWPRMAKLLDPGKTTIFNGHTHTLSYTKPNGIPTYVLPATGANYADKNSPQPEILNREKGLFRMFAHVTVDAGKPTVAIIPLHEILPGEYLFYEFQQAIRKTSVPLYPPALPAKGGTISIAYSNALPSVSDIAVTWEAPGWTVEPASSGCVSMAASTTSEITFTITPATAKPGRISCYATLTTLNNNGKKVTWDNRFAIPLYMEMVAPKAAGISVDGDAKEWQDLPALHLVGSNYLWAGQDQWLGEKDLAVVWRAAHDEDRLYVCADVNDDQIALDGKNIWDNDALEFYWDARLLKDQDGHRGPGTGQLILGVPAEGSSTVSHWEMGKQPAPQGLISSMKRRPGGYVCEFSIPLRELGCAMPIKTGDRVNLELQIDDRDMRNGTAVLKHQCASGQPGSYSSTIGYVRCTLR